MESHAAILAPKRTTVSYYLQKPPHIDHAQHLYLVPFVICTAIILSSLFIFFAESYLLAAASNGTPKQSPCSCVFFAAI